MDCSLRTVEGLALALALVLVLAGATGCGRSAASWTEEGDRLLRANDLIAAEEAYNRALAVDPHHGQAVYGKGWTLYASGHISLRPVAMQLFDRAIDYAPEFYGGYRGKAVLLLEEGQIPAAELLLRQAYEAAPDAPPVLESLGQLYFRAGRLEDAYQLFSLAVELAPNRGELRRFLADVALARGQFDAALALIEEGRGQAVGGLRGLALLDEGEERIHLEAARILMSKAKGPKDEQLRTAEAALDRAAVLLAAAEKSGMVQSDEAKSRHHIHDLLRKRLKTALEL